MAESTNDPKFLAKITSTASPVQLKSTGAKYVLHDATITEEGPMKGTKITVSRTISNAEGTVTKAPCNIGDSINAYPTIVEDARGKKAFWNAGGASNADSDESILANLASAGIQ